MTAADEGVRLEGPRDVEAPDHWTYSAAVSIASMVAEWYAIDQGGSKTDIPIHVIERRLKRFSDPALTGEERDRLREALERVCDCHDWLAEQLASSPPGTAEGIRRADKALTASVKVARAALNPQEPTHAD